MSPLSDTLIISTIFFRTTVPSVHYGYHNDINHMECRLEKKFRSEVLEQIKILEKKKKVFSKKRSGGYCHLTWGNIYRTRNNHNNIFIIYVIGSYKISIICE